MWIDPITREVVTTFSEMRALRPDWSGPVIMTEDHAVELGFCIVKFVEPVYDPETQEAKQITPVMIDGMWTQYWTVRDLNPEEVAALVAAKQEKATEEMTVYMGSVRKLRMDLLNVLTGVAIATNMLDEFRVARKALLDLPQKASIQHAIATFDVEGLREAVKEEYALIVKQTPDALRVAFKEIQP